MVHNWQKFTINAIHSIASCHIVLQDAAIVHTFCPVCEQKWQWDNEMPDKEILRCKQIQQKVWEHRMQRDMKLRHTVSLLWCNAMQFLFHVLLRERLRKRKLNYEGWIHYSVSNSQIEDLFNFIRFISNDTTE